MTQPDGSNFKLKIKKGSQRLCVESPGVHELQFVKSCISFGKSSTRINTSNPSPIYLKGETYLIEGEIHVDQISPGDKDGLPETILVDVLNDDGSVFEGTVAKLLNDGNDQSGAAVYEYSVWANPGEKLTVVPQDSRNMLAKRILFYPRHHDVLVTGDGCPSPVPLFSGRPGLYIEGSVSPPLSGVHIRIIAAGDSQIWLIYLAACEQLYNSGYRNLFWVQGGLEAAEEEDLEREGPQPFKLAGIGGVSEFLGSTTWYTLILSL